MRQDSAEHFRSLGLQNAFSRSAHRVRCRSGGWTGVGIGMEDKDFPVMQTIASQRDLAININASDLTGFLAERQLDRRSSSASGAMLIGNVLI